MNYIVASLLGLPLLTFFLAIFLPKTSPKSLAWLWIFLFLIMFVNCIILLLHIAHEPLLSYRFLWFSLPYNIRFELHFRVHVYAAIMLFVVQFVALLVYVYSIEYKKNDVHFHRFFAFLALFIFAMNGVVLSDNLLVIFIFWELMGFVSYLLIGFWYDKPKAVAASKKAFLINKIADVFFLIGILILWANVGTLELSKLLQYVQTHGTTSATMASAGFCIFLGCMGKSAQFPLQAWLPDAMEGPTPVSALIHAATMVAAGVYLMANSMFLCSPAVLQFVACIGSITAVSGAVAALSQCDLKRVLAFSTVSQLGIMMVAIGLNAPEAAFFHLFTHAFFKAGLFLSAGSVIHAMQHAHDALPIGSSKYHFDKQDMRNMGGLLKIIPITSICFIVCGLSLAGLPLFSGFISKGAVLTTTYSLSKNGEFITFFVYACVIITSFLTAFYVSKTIFRTFFGELKIKQLLAINQVKIHDSGLLILFAIITLALMSLQFNPIIYFVHHSFSALPIRVSSLEIQSEMIALFVIILGFLFSYLLFRKNVMLRSKIPLWLFSFSYQHFYLDNFIAKCIIKPVFIIANGIVYFENSLLDTFIKLVAVLQVVLANIIAFVDKSLVDGSVSLLANGVQGLSYSIKSIQKGRVQGYVFLALLFWILVGIFLLFFHK